MSELFKALILGFVEGLTEFIPVSSTGHLILVGDALGFVGEKEKAFEVFIQLGAILAVVVLYRERFLSFWRALFPIAKWFQPERYRSVEEGLDGASGIINIAVATLPALIAGAILRKQVKALFFPASVAAALIVGGLAFLLVEKFVRPGKRALSPRVCLLIGCFQALALWPGISRSGATIVGALLLGVERRTAAEFSFLAAVPIIAIAAVVDLAGVAGKLTMQDAGVFATGLVVSFVAGMASIKILIEALKRYSLKPFGYYRIVLGALVLLLSA